MLAPRGNETLGHGVGLAMQLGITILPRKMSHKRAKAKAKAPKLEYDPSVTPTRSQIITILTTPATTKAWVIKRIKEVCQMKPRPL
jgi:hypothetical protein